MFQNCGTSPVDAKPLGIMKKLSYDDHPARNEMLSQQPVGDTYSQITSGKKSVRFED